MNLSISKQQLIIKALDHYVASKSHILPAKEILEVRRIARALQDDIDDYKNSRAQVTLNGDMAQEFNDAQQLNAWDEDVF